MYELPNGTAYSEDEVSRFVFDSVVDGYCRDCKAVTTECEPDANENWCPECGGQRVASVLVLWCLV